MEPEDEEDVDIREESEAAAAARDADGMHRRGGRRPRDPRRVKAATGGLTTSAGIATNFMLARLAPTSTSPTASTGWAPA